MYFAVIVVLSLLLAFSRAPLPQVRDPGPVTFSVTLAVLLPAAAALGVNRRTLRRLERYPAEPGRGQTALAQGMMLVQTLLIACHASLLMLTDWMHLCQTVPVVGEWPVLPALLASIPFLVSVMLVWLATYPADRAIRQIALEVFLLRGRPVAPVWSLGAYLSYNVRHHVLFVLVPCVFILAARDVVRLYEAPLLARHPFLPDLLLGAAAVVVALLAPAAVRHIWLTRRLPDGPLRDKLLLLCRMLHMRFREILVWRSGGMSVNAAVMGVLAPLRYVMITDGMLGQLEDAKIEAVFGHEAGHVKRHHIFFFLLLAFVTGCIVTVLSVWVSHVQPPFYELLLASAGAALLLKWGLLFGWVSRRFEQQADVFGVRALELGGLPCQAPCAVHRPLALNLPPAAPDPSRVRLCSTAAHIFGDTLNEVALLNGIPPEARSWRHPSIAARSRFVQKLAHDPAAVQRFERSVQRIKLAILAAALASGAWAVWELKLWTLFS
jgi:STE24 endopeptidase